MEKRKKSASTARSHKISLHRKIQIYQFPLQRKHTNIDCHCRGTNNQQPLHKNTRWASYAAEETISIHYTRTQNELDLQHQKQSASTSEAHKHRSSLQRHKRSATCTNKCKMSLLCWSTKEWLFSLHCIIESPMSAWKSRDISFLCRTHIMNRWHP